MNSGFSPSPATFAAIFPFYFTFDRHLEITNMGSSLQRIYSLSASSNKFKDIFTIQDPDIVIDFDSIQFHQNFLFSISSRYDDLQLKGKMIVIDWETILFLGSPVAKNVADKLKYNDILYHSPNNDLSLILEMQNVELEQTKRGVEKLAKTQLEVYQKLVREQELSQLKTSFINTASHEFRTPLGIISSSTGLLEDYGHKMDEDRKRKHFRQIQSSVKHMTSLLEDILLIEQTDAGKLYCNKVLVKLISFCQEIVDDIEVSKNAQDRIQTSFLFQDRQMKNQGDLSIIIDPKLVRQILTNLLSNAIKYSGENSKIIFDIVICQRNISLCIKDCGIGITDRDKARLFESFSRGSNVSNIQGTGLGLSIVKRCVDLHGGSISFISEVNVGSTFTVNLPIDGIEDNPQQLIYN
jgi:signal transduction histidine kinase